MILSLKTLKKEEDYKESKEKCIKMLDFFERNKQELLLVKIYEKNKKNS